MRTNTALPLSFFLATSLLLAISPATAHNDGRTCHSHTVAPVEELTLGYTEIEWTYDALDIDTLVHGLDNHVAADPDRYDPTDVIATNARLYDFEEMVGAVRRLVTRSERIADPVEAAAAQRIAESVLSRLPIGAYLTIEDFLAENRNLTTVVVPVDTLLAYLRDTGTSDEIVAAVEDLAAGC